MDMPGPFPALLSFARSAFGRSLAFSLCLHLVVLAWVQVRPFRDMQPAVPIQAVLLNGALPAALPEAVSALPVPLPSTAASQQAKQTTPAVDAAPNPETLPVTPVPTAATAASLPGKAFAGSSSPGPAADLAIEVPSLVDTRWYGAKEVDRHPRPLQRIEPPYPETARRRGIEGSVKLRVRIDEFGRVETAEVIEGDPPGVFDAIALETVRKLRFDPAKRAGQPVRYDGYYRYGFTLD